MNQQELADLLGKSLRTVQKYETGEIEVSIAIINQLANLLDSTPTFILGYETNTEPFRNLADVMSFLFQLEKVSGMKFDIDVKKPPRSRDWTCSLTFNGKASAEFNADLCLFLEDWQNQREDANPTACPRLTTDVGRIRRLPTMRQRLWNAQSQLN